MNRQDRRAISREYFSQERLAEHHFRSFNAFLTRGMQEVVDEKATIETDIGDKEGQEPVYVELGDIRVTTPRVREADGSEELLYPQEARLRNITYAAPVFMEMSIVRGGEEEEEQVVDSTETKVGRMPIMVGSEKC
ncbi:MAG: DNA-directed RNA polymerase subunit B'', partial [Haloferacaceae archaeon]